MAKNKAPADQFYFGDYIRDTRCLTIDARGAWMDILAFGFFETPQGRISQDIDTWSRMFGTDVDTALSILEQIKARKVGDVVTLRNGEIQVSNRRIFREWQGREAGKQRVKLFRERLKQKNDANVTSLSSSSSSSSLKSSEDLKPPLIPLTGNGKEQTKPPNTELGIWLDAISVAVGAKDRRSLLKLKRWTDVCVSAMRENHGLEQMLKAIESERRRVGENVEFFTPEGVLQKLQMTGKRSKPAQGPDPESYTYVKNQPSASDDIRAEQDRINAQMAQELAAK